MMNSFKGGVTMASFKGYDKVDDSVERDYHRKTKKRFILIGFAALLLIGIAVAAAVGVSRTKYSKTPKNSESNPSTFSSSIKAVCSVTRYPNSCFSSLSSADRLNQTDPEELFKLSLQVAINELTKLSSLPEKYLPGINDQRVENALKDCQSLFDDALDELNTSLSSLNVNAGEKLLSAKKIDDLKTWLSAAITDQETCLDGFEGTTTKIREELEAAIKNSTEFTSNSLAIGTAILSILDQLDIPIHRKLLGFGISDQESVDFPAWVSAKDRKLLQESNVKPNVVVAKDGSGNYKTITEAIAAVPKQSKNRFVIYVKTGIYVENVEIDKKRWNVYIYGDGSNSTIVSGSRNFVDGIPTFSTATFVAAGKNFMAKDIGFRNTAGAEKHQAVAVRSGSDHAVFYNCNFDAYQDTLYAHSNRQFYRDCSISGTVDFIFGNAAVVFQNCLIQARQPMDQQKNTITAQGKKDPNQNTGISIQGCQITAAADLKAPTYLGRPWKDYSTTVIMKSAIEAPINEAGWLPWVGDTAPDTIYYAEYQNSGPGSVVKNRVQWKGYKAVISAEEAGKFAVDSFIQGSEWLPATGVTFTASL